MEIVTIGHLNCFRVLPATPNAVAERGAHHRDREEPGQKNGRTGGAQPIEDIDGGLCLADMVDHHVVKAVNR